MAELKVDIPSELYWKMKRKIDDLTGENQHLKVQVTGLNQQIGELKFDMNLMVSALRSVESIISNSNGIDGWHMNGDVATWGELGIDEEVAEALATMQGDGVK